MLDNYIFLKIIIEDGLFENKLDLKDYIRIRREIPTFITINENPPMIFMPIKKIYYDYEILACEERDKLELIRVDDLLIEIQRFINLIKNISKG